jgi:hypothetical protein
VRRRILLATAVGLVPLAIWSPILVHQYLGQRFSWVGPFDANRVLTAFWLLFADRLPEGGLLHTGGPVVLLGLVLVGSGLLAGRSARGPAGRPGTGGVFGALFVLTSLGPV